MTGFVGFRSKLCALKVGEYEEKKCKGVTKVVIKKNLCYDDYVKCLFTQEDERLEMSVIRSYKHDIYAETVNKIALLCNDDKRIIRDNKIHTYAYGHYAS